jgi:hypothetical protein
VLASRRALERSRQQASARATVPAGALPPPRQQRAAAEPAARSPRHQRRDDQRRLLAGGVERVRRWARARRAGLPQTARVNGPAAARRPTTAPNASAGRRRVRRLRVERDEPGRADGAEAISAGGPRRSTIRPRTGAALATRTPRSAPRRRRRGRLAVANRTSPGEHREPSGPARTMSRRRTAVRPRPP